MTLSPKKRLLEDKDAAARHRELVSSSSFHRAVEATLAEMVIGGGMNTDNMEGARSFVMRFMTIAEVPPAAPERPAQNLKR